MVLNFERLKKNVEFKKVFDSGKSYANSHFVLFRAGGRSDRTRIGITTAKKIGGSVERNRMKRRVKEIVRSISENFEKGYDMVVVIRENAKDEEFTELKKKLIEVLRKAKVLVNCSESHIN